MAETKLEIEDFSHRWLPIKDVLTYFPFCLQNYERLEVASINQVDNRTGWLESVTLQLGPTRLHPMLSSYVINNIKSYVGLLYIRDRSQSPLYVIIFLDKRSTTIHAPRLYGVVNRRSGLISDHHTSCIPIGLPINRSMADQ